jgi:hypothetical protein
MTEEILRTGDTSPIRCPITKNGAVVDLSATGFDADLSNSFAYVRKLGATTPTINARNPTAVDLANGIVQIPVLKTDFPVGSGDADCDVWILFNDQAGVDQLTTTLGILPVRDN